jgi:propanol-preferring alcohol dehydrogenase
MAPRCLGIHCDGGYAQTVRVPHERYLLPIGDMDPAALAPFACSGLTTYSALKKLQPAIHDVPVVIIGAGGLGLMAVSILKGMGGIGAVVVDIDDAKLEGARAAGALGVVNGASPTALQEVQAILGGPAWAAMDLVGSPDTASLAFNLLAKGGKMVCIGLFGGAAPWSLPLIPMKAASILGSYTGTLGELSELVELVRQGSVQPITIDRRSLDDADEALQRLHHGRQAGRAVLVPG